MKTILVVNKTYENQQTYDKKCVHDSGPLYSNERYLTLALQTFNAHIKHKSIPIHAFMSWWFQTTNYKLNPEISQSKRSWKSWLVEIFFWACIIGLFACIFAGIARPIIEATILTIKHLRGFTADPLSGKGPDPDTLNTISAIWRQQFTKEGVIAPLCFTLFFLFFSFLYFYMVKKIRPRINKMSVEEYLVAKMNFINRFKFILTRKTDMKPGLKEFNHRLVFNMNADFNLLRIMNYLYSGLKEMNLIMVIDLADDAKILELQKVIKQDFDNLGIIILDPIVAANLKSHHQNGIIANNWNQINIRNKNPDKNQEIEPIDFN